MNERTEKKKGTNRIFLKSLQVISEVKMAVTQKDSQKKDSNKENSNENAKTNPKVNELEIGASVTAQRTDGSWHPANVVHRRTNPDTTQTEYYVHYEGFNRRLDEWVKSDRIKRAQDRHEVVTRAVNADGE